jgi:hypothetical protein
MGRSDYQWRHEPILYGWKEGAAHYFVNDRTQDTVFLEDELELKKMNKQQLLALIEKVFRDYKDQTTVHYENKPTRNALHPTMKPVPLVGRLMNNSSRPGWAVGDFFGGRAPPSSQRSSWDVLPTSWSTTPGTPTSSSSGGSNSPEKRRCWPMDEKRGFSGRATT